MSTSSSSPALAPPSSSSSSSSSSKNSNEQQQGGGSGNKSPTKVVSFLKKMLERRNSGNSKDNDGDRDQNNIARRRLSMMPGQSIDIKTYHLDGYDRERAEREPKEIFSPRRRALKTKHHPIVRHAESTKVGFAPFNPGKVNQDRYIAITDFGYNKTAALFGVFDGHGALGHEVAELIAKEFPGILQQQQCLTALPPPNSPTPTNHNNNNNDDSSSNNSDPPGEANGSGGSNNNHQNNNNNNNNHNSSKSPSSGGKNNLVRIHANPKDRERSFKNNSSSSSNNDVQNSGKKEEKDDSSKGGRGGGAIADVDVPQALHNAFIQMQSILKTSSVECSFSGATGVVIYFSGDKLWIGSAGDSRVVLATKQRHSKHLVAKPLSRDHKPDIPEEKERILNMGGRVHACKGLAGEDVGPARVWLKHDDLPGLAMSRSFGDLMAQSVGVSCIPETSCHTLSPEDQFIVVASDGVWEFLSNEEVINIVASSQDPEAACAAVVAESTKRWRQEEEVIDDITCVVAFFR